MLDSCKPTYDLLCHNSSRESSLSLPWLSFPECELHRPMSLLTLTQLLLWLLDELLFLWSWLCVLLLVPLPFLSSPAVVAVAAATLFPARVALSPGRPIPATIPPPSRLARGEADEEQPAQRTNAGIEKFLSTGTA